MKCYSISRKIKQMCLTVIRKSVLMLLTFKTKKGHDGSKYLDIINLNVPRREMPKQRETVKKYSNALSPLMQFPLTTSRIRGGTHLGRREGMSSSRLAPGHSGDDGCNFLPFPIQTSLNLPQSH